MRGIVHLIVETTNHFGKGVTLLVRPRWQRVRHGRAFKNACHNVTVVNFLGAHGTNIFSLLGFGADESLMRQHKQGFAYGRAADVELFRYLSSLTGWPG